MRLIGMPLVLQILGHETKYWMSYFDVMMVTDERSLGINAETIHYKTIEAKVGGSPESLQFIL